MSLSVYHKKRKFNNTPEPEGKNNTTQHNNIFVVQRHLATRLHYDFRLEMQGVLKSWAVPKGPSMNPSDKRLAMMVEDHPVDYATFKGIIPEGNYGAGIVEIWDHGTYQLAEATPNGPQAIRNGSLKFILKGKKLKGEFALAKMKNSDSNAWLLIKHRDAYATEQPYDSETETPARSPINLALQKKKNGTLKKAAVKKKLQKK